MAVVNVWCGATTPSSARVVAKLDNGPAASLWLSTDSGMAGAVEVDELDELGPDSTAQLAASGLDPATRYYYRVADNGVIDTSITGTFRTHPTLGQPADFTVWVSSCAGGGVEDPDAIVGPVLANRVSNHPVFDTIREQAVDNDWLLGIHLGDFQYYDLGSGNHGITGGGSLANYRRGYDDVLQQPNQLGLYSQVPIAHIYDDHDWGPNNSDGTIDGRPNAIAAYRERVPHYPLGSPAADTPNYQAWTVGRCLFVLTDLRADRVPNSTADGPDKTMLGAGQKAWLANLLASSPAEFLVWFSTSQWLGTSADTWGNFVTERDELRDLFTQHQWSHRMITVYGDNHNMGIATAAHNPLGNGPVFQVSPLDTQPSTGTPSRWDAGHVNNQRGLYGSIRVNDTGDTIAVTMSGWMDGEFAFSHTYTVDTTGPPPDPDPEPPPAPAPVARAVIRTRVTWLGCDLVSGRIIAELPDIRGQVRRLIGAAESASLSVPIPLAGPGAVPLTTVLQATQPAETLIVAVVNDLPIWGGIPLDREGGTDAELRIGAVTPEGFLDRRYVGGHDLTDVDESVIVAALIGDAQVEGIGLLLDAPPTGRIRTRAYADQDDATVYQRLQELSQVVDGPEWTVDLDWTDDTMTAVAKIVRLRPRLGTAAPVPDAVFQNTTSSVFDARGSSQARYVHKEDYTDGRYANHIVAIGSGEGEDRVQAPPARDEAVLAAGAPRWERRFQPSTSITDVAVLVDHATADLGRRRHGAQTWAISARWDATPRYGVDWQLGDDVAWDLKGHRHPDGVRGQGRAIGFELDMQAGTLAPILLDPASDGGV